ncbi:MBL fold metallo-hydrolase [Dysgonomonas sp. BGC7]|uniref:MBL fold metallo-hydrolase n=1 Tax=Dysgonomonas sp. BGC7 TaxID=1658008 RepID=UPI00068296BA|nr:MBL fold metallo-hydrolase [Dysgonomonas sp. BGC7]MBD8389589.1 MBL fold metallo-hydrolase [Dysgonomonas sp. BGC7]
MKVKIFEFNPISENTYVAYDDTKECVIIDPGCFFPDEKSLLLDFILDNDLVVKHLLNTHLHFDHVFGNNFIYEQFHLETEANKEDEFLLEQFPTQLKMFGFDDTSIKAPKIAKYLKENDIVTFGDQKLIVLEIPGHSPGSIVFYNQEAGCAFVGDVLFRGSVGRTDLAGGSHHQLISGIKEKLLTLPGDTVIYSGHGPLTTIKDEIKSNFYLQ